MTRTPFPLGRKPQFDDRSRRVEFAAPLAETVRSVRHHVYGPTFRQVYGSCTGHSTAVALNTKPTHVRGRTMHDDDAIGIYALATQLDPYPGTFPGEDTGSSVLAAQKAAMQLGKSTGYLWAFGEGQLRAGVQLAPMVVGTNWYSGMFETDAQGFVTPSGSIAGGHAYAIVGFDVPGDFYWFKQTWGRDWGLRGYGKIRAADMARLLKEDGDACRPVTT